MRLLPGVAIALLSLASVASAASLDQGVEAFERRDWSGAMDAFLNVLKTDPGNARAHAYIEAIAKQIAADQQARVDRGRLAILRGASEAAEPVNEAAPLRQAADDVEHAKAYQKERELNAKIEEARVQRGLGHLPAANDLVFQVLQERPDYASAQRELSELQSRLRAALDRAESVNVTERYALEGFYAFGQANYAEAATAWSKARSIVSQGRSAQEAASSLALLHFLPYEKIAKAHVDEAQRRAEIDASFQKAVALYERRHYTEALEIFRSVAIRDPEYPRLAYYLVQVETAAEKDRAARLGEKKRQEMVALLQRGEAHLEKEQYAEAQRCFSQVLSLDPSHTRARSYLAIVTAELKRRHDPRAAQMHYEAGLIAYASGKLEEAAREWRVATRSDPNHEKATIAFAKVQKELALSKEVP
jgi:tetratricopeptide (TPR) repeat protein